MLFGDLDFVLFGVGVGAVVRYLEAHAIPVLYFDEELDELRVQIDVDHALALRALLQQRRLQVFQRILPKEQQCIKTNTKKRFLTL